MSETSEPNQGAPQLAVQGSPGRARVTAKDIFLDRDGLRPMWSILLFLALREVLSYYAGFLLLAVAPQAMKSTGQASFAAKRLFLFEGVALFGAAGATWVMAKIEGRRATAYGFAPPRWLRNLLAGFGWGFTLLSLLVSALWASGLLQFDGRLLFGVHALDYATIWIAAFLLVGLFEECLFRGYLQFTLARGLSEACRALGLRRPEAVGFWTAAVLLSFSFGLVHTSNADESAVGIGAAVAVGIALCLSLWRTGSLWWAVGFHAAWDWSQSFVYGVADSGSMVKGHLLSTHPVGSALLSGGTTGPEGSLLIFPTIALAAVAIVLTVPRHGVDFPMVETRKSPVN